MKPKPIIQIVTPKKASDSEEIDLVELTKKIVTLGKGEEFGGFLGGRFGYGTKFENGTFFMAPCCQGFCDIDGDEECESCKRDCNFEHKDSGVRVKWYKWIGRSMEWNSKPSKKVWKKIMEDCFRSLGEKK